jgi:ABC-type transport system involved in multi-copper enzyme maturation permease subunit
VISALALPLLGKELRERANRPRTYVIRVVAAVLFFGTFLWFCGSSLQAAEAGGIGGGSAVLLPVLTLQLVGIHLFIPALMCGSIAAERESGTLDLLRLTRLGPWRIVMEKFFAGLLPVVTFVLLGVPLYAVAYALGGVEPEEVLYIAWVLVLALAEVGAFTLLMSACCTTPISAFVATYALGGILCWSAPELADLVGDAVPGGAPWILTHHQFQLFVPAGLWIDTDRPGMPQWAAFAIWTVPSTVATFLALGAAQFALIRSPWTPRRVKNCLAKLALSHRLASAGWITLGWQPIFWRHCRGTVLAKPAE